MGLECGLSQPFLPYHRCNHLMHPFCSIFSKRSLGGFRQHFGEYIVVLLKCTQCSVFDRIHVKPRKLINSSQDEVKKIRKVKIFKFQGVILYIRTYTFQFAGAKDSGHYNILMFGFVVHFTS